MRPLSGLLSILLLLSSAAPVCAMEEIKVPAPKITVLTPDACKVCVVECEIECKVPVTYTKHQVPLKYFGECGTLKLILKKNDFSKPIPLPGISTPVFPLVLQALKAQHRLSNCTADAEKLEKAQATLQLLGSSYSKIHTLLMASNYLGHGKLYQWCAKQYACYVTAKQEGLPMEMQAAVARELLEKTSIFVDMPCWVAQSIPIGNEGTKKLTETSLWTTACNKADSLVLCGDNHGVLYVYDVSTQAVNQFPAHEHGIMAIEFLDEDARFLTAAQDGRIKFWDTPSRTLIQTVVCAQDNPYVCRVSPCQKKIAYNEGRILVLQKRDNLATRRLEGHEKPLQDLVFYRDGRCIATGSDDQKIKLWDIAQEQCMRTITLDAGAVRSLQVSHDGALLSVGTKNGCIAVYCLDTFLKKYALHGHTDVVWAMHFSHDNQFLVSGSVDKKIKIWYLPQQVAVKKLMLHDDQVQSMSLQRSGMLFSVSHSGQLNLCNVHEVFTRVSNCAKLLKKPLTLAQAYVIKKADEANETESLLFESEPSEDVEDDTQEQREIFESLESDLQDFLIQKWGYQSNKKM